MRSAAAEFLQAYALLRSIYGLVIALAAARMPRSRLLCNGLSSAPLWKLVSPWCQQLQRSDKLCDGAVVRCRLFGLSMSLKFFLVVFLSFLYVFLYMFLQFCSLFFAQHFSFGY